ncbi:FecR family protein [Sinomicrobium weinanense]|uniref:FecR domain-containing protein n=1 Tax=Sinomicrobium weinanense TaxID=2842200 RepID=A0A926Q3C4_9FLAO|nr:FecR family protein [Sinomicrobium weinanense]MBC9797423.1 FecR domain-containing protein [Sinomicrobium weinanense]MBU3123083.1 FecR domain-containing protein [Sinomicrobium weinanense]
MKKTGKPYKDYKTEDFLTDESFISWVQKNTSTTDWAGMLDKYPHLVPFSEEAKNMISGLKFEQRSYDESRIEDLKKRIRFKTEEFSAKERKGKVFSLSKRTAGAARNKSKKQYWLVASMIATFIVVGSLLTDFFAEKDKLEAPSDFVVRKTDKGQKLTVFLSDGTKVMLNSNSEITFEEKFNNTLRMVHLTGEAFFEVAKDTSRPFLVDANGTVTQALGTSFNIDQKGKEVQVSLVTGKVSVAQKEFNYNEILDPGEQLIIDTEEGLSAEKRNFDRNEVLAWTIGVLFFKHEESREIFEKLESWYGVEIQVEKSPETMAGWSYSGSFHNESLENVLKSIGMVKKFHFRLEGTTVIIF